MISEKILQKILGRVEKPGRYIGSEWNSIQKDHGKAKLKFVFAFPDVYEVGMSHLGLQILYDIINRKEDCLCERVFAPWPDMEEQLRAFQVPLFALESKRPLKDFDMVGFTLQYELSYTNILNMLQLSDIPLLAKDRSQVDPIIIAGGPCAFNPEPLADIIDVFVIGEGEEVILEITDIYLQAKAEKLDKEAFYQKISQVEGVYIPRYYQVTYRDDGQIAQRSSVNEFAPAIIRKRRIHDLEQAAYPQQLMVPHIETIHDRVVVEIFRGCTRGCRFCQAGMICRPIREKTIDTILDTTTHLLKSTGYDEVSLMSLSTCDFPELKTLIKRLQTEYRNQNITISLPSLRLDSDSLDVLKEIEQVRKSGLTFAPEAGTQRLRDVINKGVTDQNLEEAITMAFQEGYANIKLYFMIGLPTETDEDILGIKEIGYKVKEMFFQQPKEERKGNLKINISVSCFVPKAFTPFQWTGQESIDEFYRKINLLKEAIRDPKLSFHYHEPETSYLEAIFARGDRRLGRLLLLAYQKGCKFDGWSEYFHFDLWQEAMDELGMDGDFYACRERDDQELLPWDFIDCGVTRDYLWQEYRKASQAELTEDCRDHCQGCGVNRFYAGGRYCS